MIFKSAVVPLTAVAIAASPTCALATANVQMSYPRQALAAGEQGAVAITVTIGTDGRVKNCVVTKSSGFQDLDNGTCDEFIKYAVFRPATDDKGHPKESTWSTTVNWRLH